MLAYIFKCNFFPLSTFSLSFAKYKKLSLVPIVVISLYVLESNCGHITRDSIMLVFRLNCWWHSCKLIQSWNYCNKQFGLRSLLNHRRDAAPA